VNFLSTRQKIFIARLAHGFVKGWRRLRGAPARAEFTRGGLRWMLDLDEGVDFSIYLLGSFEPDAVRCYEKRLKPGDIVLDIGANIGAHTLQFARLVGPSGRVLAFEPTAYAHGKLRANLALNPDLVPRVTLMQSLLMDRADAPVPEAICSGWPLVHDEGLHPDHLGKPHSTEGARSTTLDAAVTAAGLDRIAFVKLDVDGHELAVLKGATETLRRFRPPILIELCPQVCVEHGYPFSTLVRCLADLGYRFESFQGRALPDDPAALEALIPAKGGINVLAVAK
jgi:FkbM family methyltransferase